MAAGARSEEVDSDFDQEQLSARSPDLLEVRIRRDERHCVTQGIGGYEQIDRLDRDAPSAERVAQVSCLFP
jgi:hypothetical protein